MHMSALWSIIGSIPVLNSVARDHLVIFYAHHADEKTDGDSRSDQS